MPAYQFCCFFNYWKQTWWHFSTSNQKSQWSCKSTYCLRNFRVVIAACWTCRWPGPSRGRQVADLQFFRTPKCNDSFLIFLACLFGTTVTWIPSMFFFGVFSTMIQTMINLHHFVNRSSEETKWLNTSKVTSCTHLLDIMDRYGWSRFFLDLRQLLYHGLARFGYCRERCTTSSKYRRH